MSQEAETSSETAEGHLFPVPSQWLEIGFYLFLLVWLAYLLNETLDYTQFEDYFFPLVLGVPLVILLVFHLVTLRYPGIVERIHPEAGESEAQSEIQSRVEEIEVEEEEAARTPAERERWEIYMIAWVIVLPLMMYYVGMGWTIVVYTFGFTVFLTRDLRQSLVVTGVVIVFIYVLFLRLLEMIIWRGVWDLPDPLSYLDALL